MTKIYSTDSGKYVLVDADGYVIAKADVPSGDHPVPDHADLTMTFDVTDSTDMSNQLSSSPANYIAGQLDPAETAFEKLANVEVDDKYQP